MRSDEMIELTPGRRVLFLTKDPVLIRRQLRGELDLRMKDLRLEDLLAPDGRLLTLAFYSYSPTPRVGPNDGQGLGRVVREIHADGSLGPIYFIRYNRHAGWNETNTRYPFYKESRDAGFVAACDALLADKLMTLQWWEDDRARDGFYATDPYTSDPRIEPKALSYFHRPDGVVVGLWKSAWSALSADEGRSWTPLVQSKTLWTNNAKIWAQRTEDGRYALVYNHSATRRNRFPVAVMTGEDGRAFDNLLCLHAEGTMTSSDIPAPPFWAPPHRFVLSVGTVLSRSGGWAARARRALTSINPSEARSPPTAVRPSAEPLHCAREE